MAGGENESKDADELDELKYIVVQAATRFGQEVLQSLKLAQNCIRCYNIIN